MPFFYVRSILHSVIRRWVFFDTLSINVQSFDVQSFDLQSFDVQSFDVQSFDVHSFNIQSFDVRPFDVQSFDVESFNIRSFDVRSFSLSTFSRWIDMIILQSMGMRSLSQKHGQITLLEESVERTIGLYKENSSGFFHSLTKKCPLIPYCNTGNFFVWKKQINCLQGSQPISGKDWTRFFILKKMVLTTRPTGWHR
jgi:hypothetical protein